MQVTETLSEGLKREFKVVVPAAELDAKVNVRLDEMKDRVRINGFRPGKVPVAHLKRMYGRSAMAEVIEATVRDANDSIVRERGYKLAAQPKVTLPTEEGAIEKLIAGNSDLDYTMAVEIVPPIALGDFKVSSSPGSATGVSVPKGRRGHRPHRRAEQTICAEDRRREGRQG
jgi:trigger factor